MPMLYLVLIYFDLFFVLFLFLFPLMFLSFENENVLFRRISVFFFLCFSRRFFVCCYICEIHIKIAIYYIYNTNTRWLLSCNILARMYKYTNKKTKSLKDVLFSRCRQTFTHTQIYIHSHLLHTHTLPTIRLVLVIYRNPLKSLEDFSSFFRFGHFFRLIFHHVNRQQQQQ